MTRIGAGNNKPSTAADGQFIGRNVRAHELFGWKSGIADVSESNCLTWSTASIGLTRAFHFGCREGGRWPEERRPSDTCRGGSVGPNLKEYVNCSPLESVS